MSSPFWVNQSSILLDKNEISQIWPKKNMTYEQNLNAITRLIIVLTFVGFFISGNGNILFAGLFSIASIIFFFLFRLMKNNATTDSPKKLTSKEIMETFQGLNNEHRLFKNIDDDDEKEKKEEIVYGKL